MVFIAQVMILLKSQKIFVKTKALMEAGEFTSDQAFLFDEEIRKLHPKGRTLGTGFYEFDPEEVK